MPRTKGSGRVALTKIEVERFFAAIPREAIRDRLLFDLIYRHGLRREEAARLRDTDVSADAIRIVRMKQGRSGTYPLHPTTQRLLRRYRCVRLHAPTNPFLFASRQHAAGRGLSASMIGNLFRRYATAAKVPIRCRHVQVLRASLGVHFGRAGLDVFDIQDWFGFQDLTSALAFVRGPVDRRDEIHRHLKLSREIARTGGTVRATVGRISAASPNGALVSMSGTRAAADGAATWPPRG